MKPNSVKSNSKYKRIRFRITARSSLINWWLVLNSRPLGPCHPVNCCIHTKRFPISIYFGRVTFIKCPTFPRLNQILWATKNFANTNINTNYLHFLNTFNFNIFFQRKFKSIFIICNRKQYFVNRLLITYTICNRFKIKLIITLIYTLSHKSTGLRPMKLQNSPRNSRNSNKIMQFALKAGSKK